VPAVTILSVRLDSVDYDEALARVRAFVQQGGVHHIATVNPEFVVIAQTHPEFRRVLNSTALNVPDGVGLMWASRRLRTPLCQRVTGQEMVERMAALGAELSAGIYFLGARAGVAERAAAALAARHPGLEVAGCYSGSPSIEEEREIVARVNASGARILFVAYGPP
jgi:N-acetylglucosaminyldiphosphoundecaprenol N-acetyl-beta-D-mannosaminyltransferase